MSQTEFTFDSKKLKKLQKKFSGLNSKLFNEKALLYTATRQKQRMMLRTESGRDINDNPFKPYNSLYALRSKKLSLTSVNLTNEAEMLNSITQSANSKEAKIFFNRVIRKGVSTEEIADFHNRLGAGRNKVIRKFFGISESDGNKIFNDYKNRIRKDLEKEGFK